MVDVSVGTTVSVPIATTCAPPALPPNPARDQGVDAYLADRPSEARERLAAARRVVPDDQVAALFHHLAQESATSAASTLVRLSLEPLPHARTERRTVEGVPSVKVKLEKVSEKKNAITDEAAWAARNALEPTTFRRHTEKLGVPPVYEGWHMQRAFVHADHVAAVYGDSLLVAAEGRASLAFDAGAALDGTRRLEVTFAQLVGETLMLQLGYNGYARESGGRNAYLAAYDATTGALVWSSQPLVGNAQEAIVSGGSVVVGYGFTAEPDFLFVVDLATGKVEQKIPVRSGPELIRLKGDRLFVRTYDTDYVFRSTTGFAPPLPAGLLASGRAALGKPAHPPDSEARCWAHRAITAMIARDVAGMREAAEHLAGTARAGSTGAARLVDLLRLNEPGTAEDKDLQRPLPSATP